MSGSRITDIMRGVSIAIGLPSRNRDDILEAIKGEEVLANSVQWDGHMEWYTTPKELRRLAVEFKKHFVVGENMFICSYGCRFSICRPGEIEDWEWEPGVEVRNAQYAYPPTDVDLFLPRVAILSRAADRLEKASWEKKKKRHEYGSDRKIIKMTVGDHRITIIWTPPQDREGIPQISQMHWDAWFEWEAKEMAKRMREDKKDLIPRRRPGDPQVYSSASR